MMITTASTPATQSLPGNTRGAVTPAMARVAMTAATARAPRGPPSETEVTATSMPARAHPPSVEPHGGGTVGISASSSAFTAWGREHGGDEPLGPTSTCPYGDSGPCVLAVQRNLAVHPEPRSSGGSGVLTSSSSSASPGGDIDPAGIPGAAAKPPLGASSMSPTHLASPASRGSAGKHRQLPPGWWGHSFYTPRPDGRAPPPARVGGTGHASPFALLARAQPRGSKSTSRR
jgi:hypothetical protein